MEKETPISDVITARIDLLRKVEREEKLHKAKMAPAYAMLDRLDSRVHAFLIAQGMQNTKVKGVATAFRKKKVSITVGDWDVTWAYIVEFKRWDLLNHAVNKTVVEQIIKDSGLVPPGVNYAAIEVVQYLREPGMTDADDAPQLEKTQ